MKKLVVFISSIIIIFGLFLYFYFHSYSYTLEYVVDDVDVKEIYNKEKGYYQFVFTYEGNDYSIITMESYTTKRNFIDEIKLEENEDYLCLVPSSSKLDVYPVCKNNEGLVSYPFLNKEEESFKYEGFQVNSLNDSTYLLWDYKGFVLLNDKSQERIQLFDKDVYNLKYVMSFKQYLLIADYDEDYSFQKMYLIDTKKGKTKTINLRYDLSFDGYFLGFKKDLVYLYDKKQGQEYYINIKKGKIYRTNNKIFVDGKWENVSDYKLKEELVTFKDSFVVNYYIKDNQLYSEIDGSYQTKIFEDVKEIVKVDNLSVYFIHKDSLYYYHPTVGIKKIMSYSEWEFNYHNMVYIFD